MKTLKINIDIISCYDGPIAIETFKSMNFTTSDNIVDLIIVDMNMVPLDGV